MASVSRNDFENKFTIYSYDDYYTKGSYRMTFTGPVYHDGTGKGTGTIRVDIPLEVLEDSIEQTAEALSVEITSVSQFVSVVNNVLAAQPAMFTQLVTGYLEAAIDLNQLATYEGLVGNENLYTKINTLIEGLPVIGDSKHILTDSSTTADWQIPLEAGLTYTFNITPQE